MNRSPKADPETMNRSPKADPETMNRSEMVVAPRFSKMKAGASEETSFPTREASRAVPETSRPEKIFSTANGSA